MANKEMDYLHILKALKEIPFGVGRKLLVNFLQGKADIASIKRNNLHRLDSFGSLAYEKYEISQLVDYLIQNGLIQQVSLGGKNSFFNKNNSKNNKQYIKILELSSKGSKELANPTLHKKKLSSNLNDSLRFPKTEITDEDRKHFLAFGTLLERFNDEQKKAIISDKCHILCIAGAGSGKTTVLTERIKFLVRYKGVDPAKILAITFTRKARQEMISRLRNNDNYNADLDAVSIETFNSFCEKILRKHNHLVYDKPVNVLTYRDKIKIVNRALSKLGYNIGTAINTYFTSYQIRGKLPEQLANIFMNDCFFIRDYLKFKNKKLDKELFQHIDSEHEKSAMIVFAVCNYIDAYMKKHGLRDFADQLLDAIMLFEIHCKNNPKLMPKFEHILIDEYQDINSTQIKLINLLASPNIFAVGDPRQSIFGWRGSDVKYILDFEKMYDGCELITLTKNYRSSKQIVNLINESIKTMGLPDLEHGVVFYDGIIKLLNFSTEQEEYEFLIQAINSSQTKRSEIFVLARTNRQLNELSESMKKRNIKHLVRSDEFKKNTAVLPKDDEVTLATIHAIKGMEAEMVFVIGSNMVNFPCKGSDHPVVDMIKIDEYDKEEEERRLFYVAMSRAKKNLIITYSGISPTYFITYNMNSIIEDNKLKIRQVKSINSKNPIIKSDKIYYKEVSASKKLNVSNELNASKDVNITAKLKEWRRGLSLHYGIPAYMVITDRTITELSDKMPITKFDLEEIHGLGNAKIKRYGDEILRIVNG
ncbi:MAG: ATP-dependent DNA helicase UvrD2 [Candidatus Woesearchaeota archaeon]